MRVLEERFRLSSDIVRAKEFYVDVLGLRLTYGGRDVVRGDEGPSILLHEADGGRIRPRTFEMELRVDDVDRLYKGRSRKGVRFAKAPF